jgi:hypothetical protein
MATTFTKIAGTTIISTGTRIVTFSSIPATYTDLLLRVSARSDTAATVVQGYFWVAYPASGSGSSRRLIGNGSSASSSTFSNGSFQVFQTSDIPAASSTSNTFGSIDCYIPNYLSSNNKSVSVDGVTENNATTAYAELTAGIINTTSAITAISFEASAGNLVNNSTFTLYGIKNS